MLEILLIVPKGSKYGKNSYLKNFLAENDVVSDFYSAWETPNLSLLTIAGVLPDCCNVTFVDEDHGEDIIYNTDYDIVALTGMTQQINRSYEICGQFKKMGVYTTIGGIHVSIFPEEAQKYADTVFIGLYWGVCWRGLRTIIFRGCCRSGMEVKVCLRLSDVIWG